MRRSLLLLALVAVSATALWFGLRPGEREPGWRSEARDVARVEPTPVCPWRDPIGDSLQLFAPATNHFVETRILSGVMAAAQRRLGRTMRPDENPLRVHRVRHEGRTVGSVLVTRVKGEHGGIELVVGVEPSGALRGVLVQGHREPPAVAAVLTNAAWLREFAGKAEGTALQPGRDLPAVPPEAARSADAIASGVRELLILLRFAEDSMEAREGLHPPHH